MNNNSIFFEVKIINSNHYYTFQKKRFEFGVIKFVNIDSYFEEITQTIKAKNIIYTYQSETEHGIFNWTIVIQHSPFELYASIVDEEIDAPDDCIIYNSPYFILEHKMDNKQ